MKNTIAITLLLGLLCALFSCSPKLNTVRQARISSSDTEIKTLNGRLVYQSNEVFIPPMQSEYAYKGPFGNKLFSVDEALEEGAIRVKVSTPYHHEELHGVLLCSQVYDCSDQPTTRSYEISVSRDMVNNAMEGKISCGYEYYKCGASTYTTWVLWLSDISI